MKKQVKALVGVGILLSEHDSDAERMQFLYEHSNNDSIFKAYGRPSSRKVSISEDIKATMLSVDGWGYKVIPASSYTFSAGFLYKERNGDIYLCYITPNHVYLILYKRKEE